MHLPSESYEPRDLLAEVGGDGPENVISAEEYLQPQVGVCFSSDSVHFIYFSIKYF